MGKEQEDKDRSAAGDGSPRAAARRAWRLPPDLLALLAGVATSCLLWPLLVRSDVAAGWAVALLAAWPLVVWLLVRGLRALLQLRAAARHPEIAANAPAEPPVRDEAEARAARGERGWLVRLCAETERGEPPTRLAVTLVRDPDGAARGVHRLSRPRRAPEEAALPDALASSLAAFLDAGIPELPEIRGANDGFRGELAIAPIGGAATGPARATFALGTAPADATEWWVHRLVVQVLDLGSSSPWLRVDVRGTAVRWDVGRPGHARFAPDVAAVGFWVGPDEREPEEVVLTLAGARGRDGQPVRWPPPIGAHATFTLPLPALGSPRSSCVRPEDAAKRRPRSVPERHGGWARISGDELTFWLPVSMGLHAAVLHRALGVGDAPAGRV